MHILFSLFLFLPFAVCSQAVPGACRMGEYLPQIKGKRVALLVNQTSVVGNQLLPDTLLKLKVDIKKIFSPEHGFRGDIPDGDFIGNSVDKKTGLPIISLYGKQRKPEAADLEDVDVVLFDIQDAGVRFYTYISTMHLMMEACAALHKKMIVLDRPNPNAHLVDGPILQEDCKSFVGMHPIPIAYGLTIGELATMINGENWLGDKTEKQTCELEVIALQNYSRRMPCHLPVKPSPNLPNVHAVALYPSLCLFEGTVISVGRGTAFPFECIGHPSLKLNFEFTPKSIPDMSKNPPLSGKLCRGEDLRKAVPKEGIDLSYIIRFYKLFPEKDKFFIPYFKKLAGTEELQKQIEKGLSEKQIKAAWKKGLEEYKVMRKKYLLYNE